MSIYRYGAKCEVIGAKYSTNDQLLAKLKLLELYDDGSGKIGDVLELPFNQLETDGGLLEFADACERFTKLKGKELDMRTQLNNIEGKSLSELTGMYNGMVPASRQVKRFRDKDAAVARLTKELSGATAKPKKEAKAKAEKKPAKAKAAKPAKATATKQESSPGIVKLVGKKSALAGKYLYKKVAENPRREGTHGWHSWNSLKDGMTYEQFIAAKGGNKHLMWDIEHEFVEVRSKPKA